MTQGDGYKDEDDLPYLGGALVFDPHPGPSRVTMHTPYEGARRMPEQKPGRSKQNYGTPPEFIRAVKKRFRVGEFDCDLAADHKNTQAVRYYDEAMNSLVQDWKLGDGWNWLNPPFGKIEPWVKRAYEQSLLGAKTLVLVPCSSMGSNWMCNWVHGKAKVIFLAGRLKFLKSEKTGKWEPLPYDCQLLVFDKEAEAGYDVWKWREDCNG